MVLNAVICQNTNVLRRLAKTFGGCLFLHSSENFFAFFFLTPNTDISEQLYPKTESQQDIQFLKEEII